MSSNEEKEYIEIDKASVGKLADDLLMVVRNFDWEPPYSVLSLLSKITELAECPGED